MSLARLLTAAVSALFLTALLGIEAIHLRGAQAHLQRQLESTAQDAATSIGLSLGNLMREVDPALVQTVVNPAFDRGHYARIEYAAPDGQAVVTRELAAEEGNYPAWFAHLFPLQGPTAESLVSSGWRQLGRVRVTSHPRFAYEQLWSTARNTLLYLLIIYALAMLALRLFLRSVLRPLHEVERAAQAISERNFVTLDVKPGTRELARVVGAMNALSRKVNEAIDAESRRAEKMQAAAYRDPVTGLLNGRGFAARFESTYEGDQQPFSGVLAMIELADLAAINRTLGPDRCDELLRSAYRQIREVVDASGGFTGRWTGGLTILTLPGLRADAARERLAAIRAQAGAALKEFGVDRAERIYCGGVEARGEEAALIAYVRRAEEAVLRAREAPEGMVVLAGTDAAGAPGGSDPVEEVREALRGRRLRLLGQTAYRMSDHRALHTEILARLADASGREMSAAQFMPIVAAHDMFRDLDMNVVRLVVERARATEDLISINVSMRSAEHPDFVEWLAEILRRDKAAAARLVFEIAEHGVVKNEAAAASFARVVRAGGAGFAIDNYGVHRDSLALIPRLKPSYIKLAGAHTQRMVSDAGARFFAESLVGAARNLDIPVIAQMIEDDATFQSLGAIGFAGYQGNLIDRPSPWPRPSR
ncbi:MAG TPA: EAL domain-containing protein [Burkholderiales bacterium]|nr:EAL domain-containing protein [Burkholderiales bacterium]